MKAGKLSLTSTLAMLCLVILCIAWETWLAPIRPGAWLLSLKALPALTALPGFWRGHLRTYQWWSMLILAYMTEGLVRGVSDPGFSATLGWIEAALSVTIFVLILIFCRRALKEKARNQATSETAVK